MPVYFSIPPKIIAGVVAIAKQIANLVSLFENFPEKI